MTLLVIGVFFLTCNKKGEYSIINEGDIKKVFLENQRLFDFAVSSNNNLIFVIDSLKIVIKDSGGIEILDLEKNNLININKSQVSTSKFNKNSAVEDFYTYDKGLLRNYMYYDDSKKGYKYIAKFDSLGSIVFEDGNIMTKMRTENHENSKKLFLYLADIPFFKYSVEVKEIDKNKLEVDSMTLNDRRIITYTLNNILNSLKIDVYYLNKITGEEHSQFFNINNER